MEIYLLRIIESFITPPGIFILLVICGYILSRRRHYQSSYVVFLTGFILFIILCMPITGKILFTLLESVEPLFITQIKNSPAQAIVVLGASRYRDAPEFKRDVVSENSLVRLRYAVYLQQLTGLPILATGGNPLESDPARLYLSEALLMQRELSDFFNVSKVWLEEKSNNTWENAQFSAKILKQKNISHVFVVTHAWHLPRAMLAFENTGIKVIPAATGYRGLLTGQPLTFLSFLPDSKAMRDTRYALHELLGLIWYKLRYT